MTRIVSLAMATLLFPVLALAAPAKVRVFEAQVHSKPEATAPVVSTLPENTAVSVSEEAEKGWRKIRLPDGGVGYVEDAAVALSDPATPPPADSAPSVAAPAPETAPAPAAPPPTTAPTHARIYVKDLDHFAELVKSDLEVHQRAESIASRTRTGKIVLFGSLGVGFVGLAAGGIAFSSADNHCASSGSGCNDRPSAAPIIAGAAIGLVGSLVGWAIMPSRNEFLDALNLWNTHHPDEPFELEHGSMGR